MQDLSSMPILKTSLATDSMHAGNQIWEANSMKAPGGASGDLPEAGQVQNTVHPAPVIEIIDGAVPVGGDQARVDGHYAPSPAVWKDTV